MKAAIAVRAIKDPVYFVTDIIGAVPEDYQVQILRDVAGYPYVAAHCGHGVGKTTTGSWILLWFIFTRMESKVITTAPTWRQVKDLLWSEVHKWARKMDLAKMGWVWPYHLTDTRLEVNEEWFATGESSDDPQKLEGYHAPSILYLVDEAKGVPDTHFISMSGGMTTDEARMVLLSTPGDTAGMFYRACTGREDKEKDTNDPSRWRVHHVNGEFSARVNQTWVQDRAKVWGPNSAIYRIRIKGEFTDTTTDTLIPYPWYEAAIDRDLPQRKSRPVRVMAVDVARYGADRTIVCYREGNRVLWLRKFDRLSVDKTADVVYDIAKDVNPDMIIVDEAGVGAGVVDILKHPSRRLTRSRTVGFNSARNPSTEELQEEFYNRRAEVYWRLRGLFERGQISLLEDEQLGAQLTSLRYEYVKKGQFIVLKMQSKEDIRRKGETSPDEADAVMMSFADDEILYQEGIGVWL